MTVFEKITALQKGKENTAPWMVGEQLKDICRREPRCEQIVLEDLASPNMSLEKCEKKIKEWADNQKNGKNCVCVPPNVAERIIREFYGLGDAPEQAKQPEKQTTGRAKILSLDDLLGDV